MLQFYSRVGVELGITVCAAPVIGEPTLAAIFLYIYIYMRMHGIVGERERSNCVLDMRCILL